MSHFTRIGKVSLSIFLLSLVTIATIGCGDTREDFVNTTINNAINNNPGAVLFNFVRGQGTINVPAATATLDFTFYSEANQQGVVTLTETQNFNSSVTIENVPTSTQSFSVVARANPGIRPNGVPLTQSSGNVSVLPETTVTADLTQSVTVPVTLDSIAFDQENPTLTVGGFLSLASLGTFSNGEVLVIDTIVTSSDPTIAEVDGNRNGQITGISAGTATITATSGNISGSTGIAVTDETMTEI